MITYCLRYNIDIKNKTKTYILDLFDVLAESPAILKESKMKNFLINIFNQFSVKLDIFGGKRLQWLGNFSEHRGLHFCSIKFILVFLKRE